VIAFLLKAAGLYFFIVLPINRFAARMAPPPPPPPGPTPSEVLLTEIRDLLKARA
jgi:large conductance mechanosensitive channel